VPLTRLRDAMLVGLGATWLSALLAVALGLGSTWATALGGKIIVSEPLRSLAESAQALSAIKQAKQLSQWIREDFREDIQPPCSLIAYLIFSYALG